MLHSRENSQMESIHVARLPWLLPQRRRCCPGCCSGWDNGRGVAASFCATGLVRIHRRAAAGGRGRLRFGFRRSGGADAPAAAVETTGDGGGGGGAAGLGAVGLVCIHRRATAGGRGRPAMRPQCWGHRWARLLRRRRQRRGGALA